MVSILSIVHRCLRNTIQHVSCHDSSLRFEPSNLIPSLLSLDYSRGGGHLIR
ncbi:hypothetical protein AVEN_134560-1, partial [Araneus ventricosus]